MVRKKPADPTKNAIEVQCRRLRDLADEMRTYGEGRKGGTLFVSWAATVVACAEELERAVADGDDELRDRLLGWAADTGKFVAKVAVTAGLTVGVTGALKGDTPADAEKLLECANRVVEQAETIEDLRRAAPVVGEMSGSAHGVGSATGTLTADTRDHQTQAEADRSPAPPSDEEAEVDPGKVPDDRPFRSGEVNQKGPDEPVSPLWTTFQVIGSLLRDLRIGMDLSLEEVSVALGVSHDRVLQIENGQVTVPDTLAAYADQLISTHDRTMPETLTDEVQALQDQLGSLKGSDE